MVHVVSFVLFWLPQSAPFLMLCTIGVLFCCKKPPADIAINTILVGLLVFSFSHTFYLVMGLYQAQHSTDPLAGLIVFLTPVVLFEWLFTGVLWKRARFAYYILIVGAGLAVAGTISSIIFTIGAAITGHLPAMAFSDLLGFTVSCLIFVVLPIYILRSTEVRARFLIPAPVVPASASVVVPVIPSSVVITPAVQSKNFLRFLWKCILGACALIALFFLLIVLAGVVSGLWTVIQQHS